MMRQRSHETESRVDTRQELSELSLTVKEKANLRVLELGAEFDEDLSWAYDDLQGRTEILSKHLADDIDEDFFIANLQLFGAMAAGSIETALEISEIADAISRSIDGLQGLMRVNGWIKDDASAELMQLATELEKRYGRQATS